ncbi:zinc finger BED domain-containing protein RICESLEEPER 1-like [Chenopodium quinoa]|uniref:zinc finger BED domain-containing protein RICESLEEPER 1-like n=1 Tax=Chenopodium quinoa TaxID=63459 RepID=UPI000B76FED8|nr:zinc finger BED domain-containing protein RICESLEEPER 1-like [Chenopodium quinoa]
MIEKCLLEWELEDVFCITVDNASSNDTAIAYMKRKINGWKTGVLKCRFLHMRCVAHIVNLVVGDGLKCVHDSIIRVRHAVRFIKQSPALLLKFKKCVADEKTNSKKLLCLDVPTRWNSTYLMLHAALALENAFDRYSEEDPHYNVELYDREGNGPPTCDDWATVKRDENMRLMACKMREKYEKYWGDPEKINLLIFIVVVLDPRYKLDYVEWMISEIYDSKVGFVLIKNLRESLYALYDEYRVLPTTDTPREDSSESRDDAPLNATQKKVDVLKNKCKKQRGREEEK